MMKAITAALLLSTPLTTLPQDNAPTRRELKELVERYFELDWKRPEDIAEQRRILERIEPLPELQPRDAKNWRKKLLKQWEKGPRLPRKGGKHYLWEEEEKGLFLLGGKLEKPKGLFIGMHGGGVNSGDARTCQSAFNGAASNRKWYAIFPQVLELTECGWTDAGTEEFVMELIERARRTARIDPDFVFLGGHSMGGYGSWTLGAHHADECAGLTPSAGAPTPILRADDTVIDIVQGIVPNLRNVAMCIFQSTDDPRVPPEPNQVAVSRLEEAKEKWGGYDFEYWEVDDNAHDLPPGGTDALLERVENKQRTPHPDRVVWQPGLIWKRQFYWLFWDVPQLNEIVVADLDREKNEIRVKTGAQLDGLHVLLSDAVVDMQREVVVFANDEEVFRGVPKRQLSTLLLTGRHGDPGRSYDTRIPLKR